VRARRHIRDAFARRSELSERHREKKFSVTRHERCAGLLSSSYTSLIRSLELTVDDVLTSLSCLSRCVGNEMHVPRMISVVSVLIADAHSVCGPHKAFALVTSLCLGILHTSSASCRKKPFDALTNLEVLKLSDTHASEVVTRKWLLDLNQELTVALMHVDEQRVEVWKSALLSMHAVHPMESSAQRHARGSRAAAEIPVRNHDSCSLCTEDEHLIRICILDRLTATAGLGVTSMCMVGPLVHLGFRV